MVNSKALQKELRDLLSFQCNLFEADIIIEECTGLDRIGILMGSPVGDDDAIKARKMAARRISGEPLQYIIGHWPFRELDLTVGPGVLIPRPETEQITDIALDILKEKNEPYFLDLCCGSGNIALSIFCECGARGTAVDISSDAIRYCTVNKERYCADIEIVQKDVFEFYGDVDDKYADLIVSNPPYVSPSDYMSNIKELRDEPKTAFVPPDGDELSFYKRLIPLYYSKLKPCGAFLFECGRYQSESIVKISEKHDFSDRKIIHDLSGNDRFVVLQR